MQKYFLLFLLLFAEILQLHAQEKKSKTPTCPDDLLYKSYLYARNNNYPKSIAVLF